MKAFHSSPRILCLFLSGVCYFNAFVNGTIFTIRFSNYPVASEIEREWLQPAARLQSY